MAERKDGLYYSPDAESFKSSNQIKRDLAIKGEIERPSGAVLHTPLPIKRDWDYWSTRLKERQSVFLETKEGETNHVKLGFDETTTLNLIGDIHAGSPWTDYDRVAQEADVIIGTPNSYVLAMGDWVDGFFFNPAQFDQIEQAPEQFAYMRSLLKHYADNDKLLVCWGGDHDNWAKKSGADPYADFAEDTGAFYMYGVGYITAEVGEQEYRISAAHRHGGSSIYNKAHAAMRLYRDNAQGADVVITAHTHQKGHVRQSVMEFGGEERPVDFISVGTYKADDDYGRKLGFGKKDANASSMYGSAIVLHKDTQRVEYFDDIITANSR